MNNIRLTGNFNYILGLKKMNEFWENKYKTKEPIWGSEASDSAIIAKDLFKKMNISDVLIPGIGYGRNAKIFIENGISVTGIEISQNAIDLASKYVSPNTKIYCGSVLDMPFDDMKFGGVFSFCLLHLFNKDERKKIIKQCYKQLKPNGYMLFTVISLKANIHGPEKKIGENRFKVSEDLYVFFYDEQNILKEFSNFGLISFEKINEPIKYDKNKPPLNCYLIKCQRSSLTNLTM